MSIWDKGTNVMLKTAGQKCTATIGGKVTDFYGIRDTAEAIETDNGGRDIVVLVTTLTVLTTLADKLGANHAVTLNGQAWKVRRSLVLDDGELTQLHIARSQ